jgi:disulfide oxidoreductase YuzD
MNGDGQCYIFSSRGIHGDSFHLKFMIQKVKPMNKRRIIQTFLCCLVLVAGDSFVHTEEASAQPQEAEEYIYELYTLENNLVEEVKPRLDAIRKTFQESRLEIESHLLALRRDFDDEKRIEAYKSSLNQAKINFQQVLQKFSDIEPQMMKGFQQWASSLEPAVGELKEDLSKAKQDQRKYAERKVRLKAILENLAQQHATVLTSTSISLDPDLALNVRLIAADLDIATQYETLSQLDFKFLKTMLDELKQQKAMLPQLKHNFSVNVHKANGKQLALGKLSEIKSNRESIHKLLLRGLHLLNVMSSFENDLGEMVCLFNSFLNHDRINHDAYQDSRPLNPKDSSGH